MSRERVQKILARAGVASRRKAEDLIVAGRVRVGGRIVRELGVRADARKDVVEVDGRRVVLAPPLYVVLHKPRGVVSTLADPEGRRTVGDLVERVPARIAPVGRLDYNTSGVLLMTNDGELANGLLHPGNEVPRVYVAKVRGTMAETDLDRWRNGVAIGGRPAAVGVRLLRHERGKTWLELTLREGRNRQIVRMAQATGFPLMRLARTSFAGLTMEGLKPGSWRHLRADELVQLKRRHGVPRTLPATRRPIESRRRR